jgi:phosphate transport system substrate-binding protein
MKEYIKEFTSDRAWGEEGYLVDKGLIPMPEEEREQFRNDARGLKNLSLK